ncbi:M23 family metallopeptidase [Patescibacteria group bacterium]|nr:M23 family metallopeptidase [Patescibacteria group bacterium]
MISLFKAVIILKRLIAAFFINVVFKFGLIILRFIFYKIVVKIYQLYLSLIKKLGWQAINWRVFPLFDGQKLTHLIIIILTIVFVNLNLFNKTQAMSSEELVGNTFLAEIISSEFSNNDQLIEEYFDEATEITPDQQVYLENLSILKSQSSVEMRLSDELDVIEGVENLFQGGGVMVRQDSAIIKKIKRLRDEIIYYLVEPGDTISVIAVKFGISVNTILWENNLSVYNLIRPNDKLVILPVTGVTHKVKKKETISSIAKTYDVTEDVIIEINKLFVVGQLKIDQQIIIPGGRKSGYAKLQTNFYSGLTAIKNLFKTDSSVLLKGNKMSWPSVGYRITQYFSWRHNGIDIANKSGTPIYSVDTGIVEFVGWGKGYGNQIVINHGGGKKTRYAHLSKFYCQKNKKVEKGEIIGLMGSTGWSTGSHLHFEVIINNRKYNPLNYIK